VDVRIVAATHQPLEQNAAEKLFRLDLYHRLAVFPVDLPALRDRREDIPMLAEYFLGKLGEDAPRRTLSADALEILMNFDWPGNVRELGHVLHRAAILCDECPTILPEHIRLRRGLRSC
jgi:DNA-binding NtrC family response regulator